MIIPTLCRLWDTYPNSYVVLINIDDFTSINDFFGHAMGDNVLKTVAGTLDCYLDEEPAQLYKLPADEYAIIHHGHQSRDDIQAWVSSLLQVFQHLVIEHESQSIQVSVTMGISAVEQSTQGLAHADMALKHAKRTRVDFLLYEDNMLLSQNVEDNLRMASAVRAAVSARRIVPYYQPIYRVATGEVVKYECLARMITDEGEVIGPAQFLPAAEKIRLYPEVTRLMLEQALECHLRSGASLALNLSIEDILGTEMREYLLARVRSQPDARFLTFEILETQELVNDHVILDFIREIQALGGQVAIDDFGSGYANFHYMTRIQADVIKIDGSLIKHLPQDANARVVVETIVTFAHKMGMETVAEFVHSADVLEAVKAIGVDYAQGFYLSEPLPSLDPKHQTA